MAYKRHKFHRQHGQFLRFTFPDDNNVPPVLSQIFLIFLVPFDGASELGPPVFLPTCGCRCMRAALMSMPEASVHKNHGAVFWKNDVRFPWQILPMQAESKADFVEKGADLPFRHRIGRAHVAHDIASLFWRKRIHHVIPLRSSSRGRSRTHR